MIQSKTEQHRDAFPPTQTWISRKIEAGDETPVRVHIMDVYADPLRIYCLGCSLGWVGEAEDLVAGFFADRLSRSAFLTRWRDSQRPLRYWLIVGFKHYLYEEIKRHRRDKRIGSATDAGADHEIDLPPPDIEFERSCAVGIVRRAMEDAEAACRDAGLSEHWEVFVMFHLKEMSLQEIAGAKGVPASRVAVMKRTAAKHFKSRVRDMVSWDGATADQVDAEVCDLIGGLS